MDNDTNKTTQTVRMATASRTNDEISIGQLISVLKHRKIWIILFFILAVSLAFGYLKITNPTYEATTTALVEPISNASSLENIFAAASTASKIDTEVQLITSFTNLQNALDKLNLDNYLDPEGVPYSDPEKKLTGASFVKRVTYSTVSNTKLVKITVSDGNPQFCADYANAVLASYTELLTGIAKRSKSAQREFIESQIPVTEELLDHASRELSTYKEESAIVQMTEKSAILSNKIANFQLMMEPLKYQIIENTSLMNALNVDNALLTIEEIAKDSSIVSLLKEYRANCKELIMYQNVDLASDDPRVFVLESSIDSKAKEVLNLVQNIIGSENSSYVKAASDYLCVSTKISAIQDMIDLYNEELSAFPVMEQEYLSYQRDVQIYESLLLSLKQSLEQTKMLEAAVAGNVNVVDIAELPEDPVSPKKLTIMMIAALGGIFMGAMFAFFLEFMDNTIRSEDVIRDIIGPEIPSLGWVPYIKNIGEVKKDYPALFVYNDPDALVSERFKGIANNIIYSTPKKIQVLSINSTDMNEGKSTVILNVSTSYAMTGKKVLLIDGDFRKPAVEPFFKLKRSKNGLSDAVVRNVPLEKCIIRPIEDIPTLHVLPPGSGTRNPGALFNSEKFGQLINNCRKVYDYIIIDCPPLSYGSEFTHFAKHLDGFVLNIRSGIALKSSLMNFIKSLDFIKTPLLGYIYYGVVAKNQSSFGHNVHGYYSYGNYSNKKYGKYYQTNSKHLYVEGTGSYSKIYKKEIKKRDALTYGKREPVLAYEHGVEYAFGAAPSKIRPVKLNNEASLNTNDSVMDQKTSDMLSDIENILIK